MAASLVTARKTLRSVPSRTRFQTINFWQIVATTVPIRIVWVFREVGGHLISPTADAPVWIAIPSPSRRSNLIEGLVQVLPRRSEIQPEQRPRLRGVAVISWSGLREHRQPGGRAADPVEHRQW